jgi:hypothetical protein
MRSLAAHDIIHLWENCATQGRAERMLAILARAAPEGIDDLRALAVGARDVRLMALRARMFGAELELVSRCPACATDVELKLTARDIGLDGGAVITAETAPPRTVTLGGHAFVLRPITAGDLCEAERLPNLDAVCRHLLEACVVSVDGVADAAVPQDLAQAVEQELEALDPAADILLEFNCPACAARWPEVFDIGEILWADIRRQAVRILSDVAELARIYHWSEREILAMPAGRRHFYLEAGRS